MITAKEIMQTSPPVLKFDESVLQAITYMSQQPTDFIAVRAADDRYQGVLTEASLMRIYLKYQTQKDKEALVFYREYFEPMQLIIESEPFPEIVKKVLTAVGHRVFVIDGKSKVIGFISAKNILPMLAGGGIGPSKNQSGISEPLQSNLYLYESFFYNSPFLMHSANQTGTIQMANEVLHKVLGYEYGELIGKTIFDIYPKENHKKAEEGLKKILDRGYHKITTGTMVRKDQTQIEVELVSKALMDQNNHPIGTITVSRPMDIKVLLKSLPQ